MFHCLDFGLTDTCQAPRGQAPSQALCCWSPGTDPADHNLLQCRPTCNNPSAVYWSVQCVQGVSLVCQTTRGVHCQCSGLRSWGLTDKAGMPSEFWIVCRPIFRLLFYHNQITSHWNSGKGCNFPLFFLERVGNFCLGRVKVCHPVLHTPIYNLFKSTPTPGRKGGVLDSSTVRNMFKIGESVYITTFRHICGRGLFAGLTVHVYMSSRSRAQGSHTHTVKPHWLR